MHVQGRTLKAVHSMLTQNRIDTSHVIGTKGAIVHRLMWHVSWVEHEEELTPNTRYLFMHFVMETSEGFSEDH